MEDCSGFTTCRPCILNKCTWAEEWSAGVQLCTLILKNQTGNWNVWVNPLYLDICPPVIKKRDAIQLPSVESSNPWMGLASFFLFSSLPSSQCGYKEEFEDEGQILLRNEFHFAASVAAFVEPKLLHNHNIHFD